MSETVEPRVWVGCLACYNEGRLLGDWFAADEAPTDEEEFNSAVKNLPSGHTHGLNPHEEFWVMDHEGIPVSGEFSPSAAREYAEWLEKLGGGEHEAFEAYLKIADPFNEDSVENFHEAYAGSYDSDSDFAQELADDLGFKQPEEWPYSCIDWDHAANELMYDYASEGGHYFRMV